MHVCDFCDSDEKQVWINMGQFSECQGCKVVGTNSYDVPCACGEFDYLYAKPGMNSEAKCSACQRGTAGAASQQR